MPVTASAVLLWLRQSTAHALGHGFQTKRFSARTVGLTAADEVVGAHAVRGEELHYSVAQKDLRTQTPSARKMPLPGKNPCLT